jgi:hypothetical protein
VLVVAFIPSPKFHETDVIDAPETLGKSMNVIGEPAIPSLVEAASRRVMTGVDEVSRMATTAAMIMIKATTRATCFLEMPFLFIRGT